MRKSIFFCVICSFLFSCSKKFSPASPQQTTGYLYYHDPASDGGGLYFLSDSNHHENLYFYTDSGDQFLNITGFIDSVNKHLRVSYLDEGRRGCPFCQVSPPLQIRIVKLLSMLKE